MSDFKQRRRFLQLAGTGVAASVAGCSDLSVTDDGDDGAESGLTAIVEPDPDDLQELEQEAVEGDLSQEEAQQRQMELFESAIEDFEDRAAAEDDDDLRIEESEADTGIYLVDGSDETLMDALRSGDITVLAGDALYDQLMQQQQQGQQPEGGEEIDEEELEEFEEELEEEMEEAEEEAEGDDD